MVLGREAEQGQGEALRAAGATVMSADSLAESLTSLHSRGMDSLLVESGGRLAGALLDAGCVDRVYQVLSPVWLGRGVAAWAGMTPRQLEGATRWHTVDRMVLGDDDVDDGALTMFTGIITDVGLVRAAHALAEGRELEIAAGWTDVMLGESIAIDGACLTVTRIGDGAFTVHVITTTLGRTMFEEYAVGRRVNLERALRAGDRLGGHLVQGHVDGVGRVEAVAQQGDARLLDLGVPPAVASVSIPLGSVAVDGVSLTINAIPRPGTIQVALIPFTLEHTTLGDRRPGDRVHLEGDTVGKYVQQQSAAWRAVAEPS